MRFSKFHTDNIFKIPKFIRRLILIFFDIICITISYFLCLYLVNIEYNYSFLDIFRPFLSIIFISIFFNILLGQYIGITRYIGSKDFYKIIYRTTFIIIVISFLQYSFSIEILELKALFLLWIFIISLTSLIRVLLRDLILYFKKVKRSDKKRILIYGAGSAGSEIANNLIRSNTHEIISFIDDSPDLWGREINGIKIISPSKICLINNNIDQVFIAIPSISISRKKQIFSKFFKYDIPVLELPSIKDVIKGKALISQIKSIQIEDLLGRDSFLINEELINEKINGSVVFVTGGGGSIGSELCLQILHFKPTKIIILEQSEHNLYLISQELNKSSSEKVLIKTYLGSAKERSLIEKIFAENSIDFVFHCAAYKHVPIVERNPISGIKNNVLSTKIICDLAYKFNVKNVLLISTDKAVRPTNIMGASKRVCELIIQAYAKEVNSNTNQIKTIFSMVRFGNVLGSSGSVVPLFINQISQGGPITLTHSEVVRYFMTIKEASQLVLQASCLSKGAEVFLLDMGNQVRILELAKKIIYFSGLKVKDKNHPEGDIEIITTGLRPGEKLTEELLINAKAESTSHPLIFKANEKSLDAGELWVKIDNLKIALENQNIEMTLRILSELVPEWERKDN